MARFRTIAAIILTIIFINGCATQPQVVEKPVEFTKPALILPALEPISQLPFDWKVIVNGADVYFALSPDGYHALSLDIAQLRIFIEKQKLEIDALKQYYMEPTKNAP